jgi:DNA-directed RNA polymerase specialized sigma24 family protein
MATPPTEIDPGLDDISTEWEVVRDPPGFVLRYAPAIQRYMRALIKNRHDAEEVAQDFFLRVSQQCFAHTRKEGGRFRDYLKTAVRHAALTFLKRHRAAKPLQARVLQAQVDADQA